MAANSQQQQHPCSKLPNEKYSRISLTQNQPIMSGTAPGGGQFIASQFMTQNNHDSRTSKNYGNPVTFHSDVFWFHILS
jgi:hypothetical protein